MSASISRALWAGRIFVNGPVLVLLCGPLVLFAKLRENGFVPNVKPWFALPVFFLGFMLAWLWWSFAVPRWRVWAYGTVDDLVALKRAAVRAGITWPDGHLFSRTEIKPKALAARERQLELEFETGRRRVGVLAERQ